MKPLNKHLTFEHLAEESKPDWTVPSWMKTSSLLLSVISALSSMMVIYPTYYIFTKSNTTIGYTLFIFFALAITVFLVVLEFLKRKFSKGEIPIWQIIALYLLSFGLSNYGGYSISTVVNQNVNRLKITNELQIDSINQTYTKKVDSLSSLSFYSSEEYNVLKSQIEQVRTSIDELPKPKAIYRSDSAYQYILQEKERFNNNLREERENLLKRLNVLTLQETKKDSLFNSRLQNQIQRLEDSYNKQLQTINTTSTGELQTAESGKMMVGLIMVLLSIFEIFHFVINRMIYKIQIAPILFARSAKGKQYYNGQLLLKMLFERRNSENEITTATLSGIFSIVGIDFEEATNYFNKFQQVGILQKGSPETTDKGKKLIRARFNETDIENVLNQWYSQLCTSWVTDTNLL